MIAIAILDFYYCLNARRKGAKERTKRRMIICIAPR